MPFFQAFFCFHVLHNARHKILTIFMMLKMFSCADLFSRPLCWSIYWWIMSFFLWFWIYWKNHHRVYITTVTGISVSNQGNVREKSGNFFLPTPWQPWSGLLEFPGEHRNTWFFFYKFVFNFQISRKYFCSILTILIQCSNGIKKPSPILQSAVYLLISARPSAGTGRTMFPAHKFTWLVLKVNNLLQI